MLFVITLIDILLMIFLKFLNVTRYVHDRVHVHFNFIIHYHPKPNHYCMYFLANIQLFLLFLPLHPHHDHDLILRTPAIIQN